MFCASLVSTLVFYSLSYAYPLHSSFQPATRDSNGAVPAHNAYVKEPVTRGTIGLLWSCLTTLGLCAWSAVHLNVPQSASVLKTSANRLAWMSMAAVLPEYVLWQALRQWTAARDLLKIVNTIGASAAAGMQLVCLAKDGQYSCTMLIESPDPH